jgi:prepilin-type processing-associated H-X9-DG protein
VEGARVVPWTKPEDIAYEATKPLPRLGGVQKNGFNCLFADGRTRYLPRQVPESYLRAIITPAGNEIVPEP